MYPSTRRLRHEYSPSPEGVHFRRGCFNHKHDSVERAIHLIGCALATLLAFRRTLALLGANPLDGLTARTYDRTAPLVTPFVGLFSYDHATVGAVSF